MNRNLYPLCLAALLTPGAFAAQVLHLPMEVNGNAAHENVSNYDIPFFGNHAPENIPGARGNALRFDGYSTYLQGNLPAGAKEVPALTFSMWVAPETYPVVAMDQRTDEKIRLAGTLDEATRSGWQFLLGYDGHYAFECYSGGWKVTVNASGLLPMGEWSHLTAVADGASKTVTLYRNGTPVGSAKSMTTFDNSATRLTVGKSDALSMNGPFHINTFNGLIDDLEIAEGTKSESDLKAVTAEHTADLSIPSSRFAGQAMRPRFHGMPAANWTNECHGMTFSNGRFHLFFQKNANGPYMTRLHWGHISSADLCSWREEPIAIAPGADYDIKGCWSGAIISDPVLTAGKPAAIYTAVDYARATICMANPADDNLVKWNKLTSNPLINGRPAGLSDDFRDPNFFRNGDNCYIIVGSSKDGVGTTTLHKMDPNTKTFSNDGKLFFTGVNSSFDGTFWEMPTITEMEGGKWLFTATPLGTSDGVRCQYWTGSINADGTFKPDSQYARTVEMNSKQGYGLLSPTIYKHEGKVIALGIVPDKLPWDRNYELGWAHCYSLPREWSLGSDGRLCQKPWSGLAAMRGNNTETLPAQTLNGDVELGKVHGPQAEILATFEVGSAPCGLKLFRNSAAEATLTYANGTVTLDLSGLNRWENDTHAYNGIYRLPLGESLQAGSQLKLNVFIDGSIMDIFVNDKYAQSVRVFCTDPDATGIAAFGQGAKLTGLQAWSLNPGAGIDDIVNDYDSAAERPFVDVYHISGRLVKAGVARSQAAEGLEPGLYIIDGKKTLI